MCQRLHVLFVQAGYTMIVIFQDDKSDTISTGMSFNLIIILQHIWHCSLFGEFA